MNPITTFEKPDRREAVRAISRSGVCLATFLGLLAIGGSWLVPALTSSAMAQESTAQASREDTIKAIGANFSSIPTMSGEFVQFGPNGEQTGGVFYIERPGKIRFNYENPASIEVISNGKTVAIHNKKLETWDFYPLDKTPLKLLLDDSIDVASDSIRTIVAEPDLTTVVMGDEKIFGDAEITLMFDPKSYDLRQWTIKDAAGKETSVMVFNVEKNVSISSGLFKFDELAIQRRMRELRK